MTTKKQYDCIIIGAGPAGLSAAIQAKRLGIRLVVLERDRAGGQALAAHSIENYPGCPMGISGKQLMKRFTDHADKLGIEILAREAKGVSWADGTYHASTNDGVLSSRTLVIACGLTPALLNVKGARELTGSQLFYYTDPARIDHAGKRVLVIGGGDAAFDQAIGFAERASTVTIAMRGASPRCLFLLTRRAARRKIKIMRSVSPTSLTKDGDAVKVIFSPTGGVHTRKDWETQADYVIACTGKRADLSLLNSLGKGRIPLKPGAIKKWPGLYLAGDVCRGNVRQISIAAGDGMQAAMDIHSYLIETSSDEHPFMCG